MPVTNDSRLWTSHSWWSLVNWGPLRRCCSRLSLMVAKCRKRQQHSPIHPVHCLLKLTRPSRRLCHKLGGWREEGGEAYTRKCKWMWISEGTWFRDHFWSPKDFRGSLPAKPRAGLFQYLLEYRRMIIFHHCPYFQPSICLNGIPRESIRKTALCLAWPHDFDLIVDFSNGFISLCFFLIVEFSQLIHVRKTRCCQ